MTQETPTAPPAELAKQADRFRSIGVALFAAPNPPTFLAIGARYATVCKSIATFFLNFPRKDGAVERYEVSDALVAFATELEKVLVAFQDETLDAEKDIRPMIEALAPQIEKTQARMVRALLATAGSTTSDENITLDEAKERFMGWLTEAGMIKPPTE